MSAAPLTLVQAAAELGGKPRWLNQWLRKHPADKAGEPYYTPVGRDKVFHPADIARIERALREGVTCHSSSGRRVPVKRRTTKSVAPTAVSTLKLAAELTGDQTLLENCDGSSGSSTNSANTPRPKLNLIQGSRTS
jgi:hypothetical protein